MADGRRYCNDCLPESAGASTWTRCPYCAEEILAEALKCKHCGELLKKRDDRQAHPSSPATEMSGQAEDTPVEVSGPEVVSETSLRLSADTARRFRFGGFALIAIGIVLNILLLAYESAGKQLGIHPGALVVLGLFGGCILQFIGCSLLAHGKGYNPLVGLIGLLGCLGSMIVIILSNKYEKPVADKT
ncbi:hypothetical protein ACFL2Q_13230 [Thermodesulfobacteriota bacterium]